MPKVDEPKATTTKDDLDKAMDHLHDAVHRIRNAGIGHGAVHVEEATRKLEGLLKKGGRAH